jgi:hypothetical protein
MRIPPSASVAAKPSRLRPRVRNDSAALVVCAALTLALLFLVCRIASFW